MKIILPANVEKIIGILEAAGYEAYAVGGCVRDSVLGRIPADWDITTSAKPKQVKALFKRTVDTGIEHGTVTVMMEKMGYEVTTYRIDGEYRDNRHPSEVSFTDDLTEDLRRRDFTINAMAYSESRGLVDVFGGIRDLEEGVIRCVGNAGERFGEDALRILRAVRFAAQLGFVIEEETAKAAELLAGSLKNISAERIQTELVKLLVSPHPELLYQAWKLGLTKVFLPEFDVCMETEQNNPHHMYSVGMHTLKALEYVEENRVLRLAVLCHDFGKPAVKTTVDGTDHFHGHGKISEELTKKMMRRLKFDNDTISKVSRLVRYHDLRPEPTPRAVRRAVNQVGEDLFPALLQVCGADILAQSSYQKQQKLMRLDRIQELYEEIRNRGECVSLKSLAVTGKDLIEAGMKPGKEMGAALQKLLEHVLDEPEHNTREYMMEHWRELTGV